MILQAQAAGKPHRAQVRPGQELGADAAGFCAGVVEAVGGQHAAHALRRKLGEGDAHRRVAQVLVVGELVPPGGVGEAVGDEPAGRVLCVLVAEVEPEPVQQLNGVQPQAAHLPLVVVAEVREPAVQCADELDFFAGADIFPACRVGGSLQIHK